MADKTSLGVVGYLLGGAMLAVTVVGSFVVTSHISGKSRLDGYAMAQSDLPSLAPIAVSNVH